MTNPNPYTRCESDAGRLVHSCPGSLARTVRPYALHCVDPGSTLPIIRHPSTCPEQHEPPSAQCLDPLEPVPEHPRCFSHHPVVRPPCKVITSSKRQCIFGDECSPCFATSCHRQLYRSQLNPCAPCAPCPVAPLVDCTPNLPPQPCGESAWRPTPPAIRGALNTQRAHEPCTTRPECNPCPDVGTCDRECCSRDLKLPRSDYKLELCTNCPRACLCPCGSYDIATKYSCGTIGRRQNNERVTTKYSYPGYLDVEGGIDISCSPRIACRLYTGEIFSNTTRKPVALRNNIITPPRGLKEICKEPCGCSELQQGLQVVGRA